MLATVTFLMDTSLCFAANLASVTVVNEAIDAPRTPCNNVSTSVGAIAIPVSCDEIADSAKVKSNMVVLQKGLFVKLWQLYTHFRRCVIYFQPIANFFHTNSRNLPCWHSAIKIETTIVTIKNSANIVC